MTVIIHWTSIAVLFKLVWLTLLHVNYCQWCICCVSVLQWSCYSSQCIVAKETCCQPPRLFLSLHCLPLSLPLLHCPWPQGTVGFLNALPPLWAHIDWLSTPPKAEQHGMPAASFLLVLLQKSLKREREKKIRRGEEKIIRRLHHNLSRYVSSALCLRLWL